MIGGWNIFGKESSLIKSFKNIIPHYKARIKCRVYKIDEWNADNITIRIDNSTIPIINITFNNENDKFMFGDYCGNMLPEDTQVIDFELNHSSSQMEITFSSTISNYNGFWGISDVIFWVFKCHSSCANCTGPSIEQCISIKACDESFYFNKINEICQDCHNTCKKCLGPYHNNCTECFENAYLNLGLNTCECDYSNGFYNNFNFENNKTHSECRKCDLSCKSCFGSSSKECSSCFENYHLNSGSCDCIEGFYSTYDVDSEVKNCKKCNSSCKICSSLTECLICSDNAHTSENISGTCECNSNFYPNNDSEYFVCIPCETTSENQKCIKSNREETTNRLIKYIIIILIIFFCILIAFLCKKIYECFRKKKREQYREVQLVHDPNRKYRII